MKLVELSTKMIDEGGDLGPTNRITQELSELGDDIAIVESFSHVVAFRTGEGLLLFDTSGKYTGAEVVKSLRRWSDAPVHTAVYTHGHVDHVGGAAAFVEDGLNRGHDKTRFVGHDNVAHRLDRYELTNGYNLAVNRRQVGGGGDLQAPDNFLPPGTPRPDLSYADTVNINVGELDVHLKHSRGETDDHTWAWLPKHKAICAGDFFIWNFPNAGNPQKVQRYPMEWARALRHMAEQGAELFIPAHGLPIGGAERIRRVLIDVADVLDALVNETLERMNEGQSLDTILHEVSVPKEVLQRVYLRPLYDEPEFVVRNVWRQFGGWYDQNPARLKPPRDSEVAAEVAQLAGGTAKLVERAQALSEAHNHRMACQLVELAVQSAPEDRKAHQARYEIYLARRKTETSLMAKGIFSTAARESWAIANPGEPYPMPKRRITSYHI